MEPFHYKRYTRNTDGIQHTLRTEHLGLLNEMITAGSTMLDVKMGVFFLSELRKMGLTLEDFQEILAYLQSRKTLIPHLLDGISELRDNGITYERLVKLDQYNKTLETNGIDLDFIEHLNDLEKKYGSKESIMKSVLLYSDLGKIRSEITKWREERAK